MLSLQIPTAMINRLLYDGLAFICNRERFMPDQLIEQSALSMVVFSDHRDHGSFRFGQGAQACHIVRSPWQCGQN